MEQCDNATIVCSMDMFSHLYRCPYMYINKLFGVRRLISSFAWLNILQTKKVEWMNVNFSFHTWFEFRKYDRLHENRTDLHCVEDLFLRVFFACVAADSQWKQFFFSIFINWSLVINICIHSFRQRSDWRKRGEI